MTALNRKLVRDLWQTRGQAFAIAMVMACGVATLVMSLATLEAMRNAQQTYYDRYRFAHVFASLVRAPNSLAERIRAIPGVAQVQTRVSQGVILDVPGLDEPAVGLLLSIPDRPAPGLNEVHLRRGRYIEPGHRTEVLVSEPFADAHKLNPGDRVTAILNGRRQEMHIVGIALSPEYVFSLRAGEMLPDDKRFGILWMGDEELSAAFDMDGAFNDVALSLMRGASEPEVIRQLDLLTADYGGVGAYGRKDQTSNRFLSDEIAQLRIMGTYVPLIFLGVAAFLLNVVISRLIAQQREQIAALKAFGYTKPEIGWHYLKYVLLIVIVGCVIGSVMGGVLGRGLTTMYTKLYRFPVFTFYVPTSVLAMGLLTSMAAGLLGTIGSVRRAVILPPAEAMRPEPPADFKPTIIERLGLQRWMPQTARMILRQLERKPFKALLSSLGIAMAAAVLVVGQFTQDAVNYLMDFQFSLAQRQDVTVSLVETSTASVKYELENLPGVLRSEPFRYLPIRVRHGHREYRLVIVGLSPDPQLMRVMDRSEKAISLPPDGLIISEKLGEILHVQPGDTIRVEVLEGRRPVLEIPVAGFVSDLSGTNAYMDLSALHRWLGEGENISGAFLMVDPARESELFRVLKNTPMVAGVTLQHASIESFRDTFAENMKQMQRFNLTFAVIIAVGVVYNTARISLSERSRELATLRVIGFTRAEISAILLGELAVLTLVAIPLGMGIGFGLAAWISAALDTDMFRIPLIITPSTFALATTVVLLAAIGTGLIVRRKLDHLDLVSVLKQKE